MTGMPQTSDLPGDITAAISGRDLGLDRLRIAGALAVVCIHVATQVNIGSKLYSESWWVSAIAQAATNWGALAFVMISGALLLSKPSEAAPLLFYRKKAARILIPLVFWTLFYIAFMSYIDQPIGITATVKSVLSGSPFYHLWFLYMLLGLYAATPFLRPIVTTCSPDSLRIFIVGSLLIAFADSLMTAFYGRSPALFVTRFIPYIGYFVAGYYLYTHAAYTADKPPRRGWLWAVIGVSPVLIALGFAVSQPMLGATTGRLLMYSNFNPLLIVLTLCIFILFATRADHHAVKSSFPVAALSSTTLGIYVIHPFWLRILSDQGLNGFWINPIVGIPVATLTIFALSAVSASLLSKIPFLRAVVK